MNPSIRLNQGIKKIEVNDNGDYILLPVGDDSFLKRYYSLLDQAKSKAEEEFAKRSENDIIGTMDGAIEFDMEMKRGIDALFGPDTCKKVFGDLLPGVEMFMEFFDALLPFLQEYHNNRIEKMNKYGAGRVGSSV